MSHEVNEKKYVVVDTWLLETALTMPANPRQIESVYGAAEVLSRILRKCHRIVLDYDGDILAEYRRHNRGFVGRWLEVVTRYSDKVAYRPRAQIRLTVHFDPDDLKFLEVAVNSPHRIIISGDSDFTYIKNHAEIRAYDIHIIDLDEALSEL